MKIKADTTALEMSLMKAAGTIALKLKGMVQGFAYEFTLKAIENTPLGDSEKYFNLYQRRTFDQNWQSYGLEPIEGFAQGAWQISLDGKLNVQEFYGSTSGDTAAKIAQLKSKGYQLGDKIYIGNYGPYIQSLESGGEISKPTLDQVQAAYKIELQRYYNSTSTSR